MNFFLFFIFFRLLKLAGNNFGIIDAFPDFDVNFFIGTRLSAVNFERWLKLVEDGDHLISESEGRKLYTEFKGSDRKTRVKNLLIKK
jgi:hypothetical protein